MTFPKEMEETLKFLFGSGIIAIVLLIFNICLISLFLIKIRMRSKLRRLKKLEKDLGVLINET